MFLIGALVILTLFAAADGLLVLRRDFGESWKRTVRRPEFAAPVVFAAVVLLDIAFTMQRPEWIYLPHTPIDTALLVLPLLPAFVWLVTQAVNQTENRVPIRTIVLLMACDLIWTGIAAAWSVWIVRLGAVASAEEFTGVLEGILPLLGLPLAAWGLARRLRQHV